MENKNNFKFEEQDGVAILTLDNPKFNSLTPLLLEELRKTIHHCRYNANIRCVLITAEGGFFSVGADIQSMLKAGDQLNMMGRKVADSLHHALSDILRMEKPVVTAINGFAAGGGFGLAVAGDYVIASDQARFSLSYTNSGLSPDGGSTYLLPRLIGIRRTVELAFTNRILSAQEALDWHMVNQVVAAEKLSDTALEFAKNLATGPTDAYGYIKKLMLMSLANSFEEQTEFEKEGIVNQLTSYNGQEGIKAFAEKRKPNFK